MDSIIGGMDYTGIMTGYYTKSELKQKIEDLLKGNEQTAYTWHYIMYLCLIMGTPTSTNAMYILSYVEMIPNVF